MSEKILREDGNIRREESRNRRSWRERGGEDVEGEERVVLRGLMTIEEKEGEREVLTLNSSAAAA